MKHSESVLLIAVFHPAVESVKHRRRIEPESIVKTDEMKPAQHLCRTVHVPPVSVGDVFGDLLEMPQRDFQGNKAGFGKSAGRLHHVRIGTRRDNTRRRRQFVEQPRLRLHQAHQDQFQFGRSAEPSRRFRGGRTRPPKCKTVVELCRFLFRAIGRQFTDKGNGVAPMAVANPNNTSRVPRVSSKPGRRTSKPKETGAAMLAGVVILLLRFGSGAGKVARFSAPMPARAEIQRCGDTRPQRPAPQGGNHSAGKVCGQTVASGFESTSHREPPATQTKRGCRWFSDFTFAPRHSPRRAPRAPKYANAGWNNPPDESRFSPHADAKQNYEPANGSDWQGTARSKRLTLT